MSLLHALYSRLVPIFEINAYISPNGSIFVDFAKELRLPDFSASIRSVLVEDQTQWGNSQLGLANSGHLWSAEGFVCATIQHIRSIS